MQRFVPSSREVKTERGAFYAPFVADTVDNKDYHCMVLGNPGKFYKEVIAYGVAARKAKKANEVGFYGDKPKEPTRPVVPVEVSVMNRYGILPWRPKAKKGAL